MCTPLRSALFATASRTASRRRSASSACTRTTRSPSQPEASTTSSHPGGRRFGRTTSTSPAPGSATGSSWTSSASSPPEGDVPGSPRIHHCTLPGPNGPSARNVAGGDHGERAFGEGPGGGAADAHPQHRALELVRLLVLVLLHRHALGVALDDDAAGVRVPREAHRADPELLLDGGVERVVVLGID